MSNTLLVTGASGQLGRLVITHLLDTYETPKARINAGSRSPETLTDLTARGVRVTRMDFEDSSSLSAAVTSVERMLLISTDAIDRPGRRLAQHQAAIAAAAKAGVSHIVYTSMPNPDNSLIAFAPDHFSTERALAESGLGWTILRNSWYMENLLDPIRSALASRKWFTSSGNGHVAYVSREDCARAAAAALALNVDRTATYNVTGTERHSPFDLAMVVNDLFDGRIEVVQLSDELFMNHLIAGGISPVGAALQVAFDANTREGRADVLSRAVEQLSGKPAQTLRDFLIRHKAALTAAA